MTAWIDQFVRLIGDAFCLYALAEFDRGRRGERRKDDKSNTVGFLSLFSLGTTPPPPPASSSSSSNDDEWPTRGGGGGSHREYPSRRARIFSNNRVSLAGFDGMDQN